MHSANTYLDMYSLLHLLQFIVESSYVLICSILTILAYATFLSHGLNAALQLENLIWKMNN